MGIYKTPTICVDFDDTLAPGVWPDMPETMLPGAKEALQTLHGAGAHIMVASTRLNPYNFYSWPARVLRPEWQVRQDEDNVREFLDKQGCGFVEVYNDKGKCPADLYVDDKAVWYPGRPNSWKKMVPVIMEKVGLNAGEYLGD